MAHYQYALITITKNPSGTKTGRVDAIGTLQEMRQQQQPAVNMVWVVHTSIKVGDIIPNPRTNLDHPGESRRLTQ